MSTPLLETWDTPHGLPPFGEIKEADYRPAFTEAFRQHSAEINAIAASAEIATFDNTIAAMERAGSLLTRVVSVFNSLASTDSTDELQHIEAEVMPKLAIHQSGIFTRQDLYQRICKVHGERDTLHNDQRLLVEEVHKRFVRAGAALSEDARGVVQKLDEELASLETRFGQNVLNDTNQFEMLLETPEDVAGLPDMLLQSAAEAAQGKGESGYLFTISRSSITPFLQFADRRDLREKIYTAYTACADNANDNNNRQVLSSIASLRAKRASVMGFDSHAHFMLDDRMAKTPTNVNQLLDAVWKPAKQRVTEEAADLQDLIQADGGNFTLAPWDWWYYTEKLRTERFALNEEEVKPYFKLENVANGAFDVANRLFGITFKETTEVPVFHPEVKAYEVSDSDGSLIGIFLVDYFMRSSKRGGAWMSNFREQSNMDEPVYPIVINCCNFPKGQPTLLGMDEVRTLFHEFGHGLHGLLSKVTYPGQSGTNVKQDFVELPSQIMEHWAIEKDVLRTYARHYETGEVIPDELIDKLIESDKFNQGFATTEYLAACYLDMAWHSQSLDQSNEQSSVNALEDHMAADMGLIDAVDPRYKSTYFQHIFSGESYSAGYYAYIWAEVLDADGFEAFRDSGIFDPATAQSFRTNILEKGGTEDPMVLYKRFRGREPEVEPLLKHRGLA